MKPMRTQFTSMSRYRAMPLATPAHVRPRLTRYG